MQIRSTTIMKSQLLNILLLFCSTTVFGMNVFDMNEIRDPDTLEIKVLQNWHQVKGLIETRQKLVTINVGDLWSGQEYRVPVRMVSSDRGKFPFPTAKGHQAQCN